MTDHVVFADHYDRHDLVATAKGVRAFSSARTRLAKVVPTGRSALEDLFFLLLKADPRFVVFDQIPPELMINQRVLTELMSSSAFQALRGFSVGDQVQAAMSAADLERTLRAVFDRFEQEAKAAQRIIELQAEVVSAEGELTSAEEQFGDAIDEDDDSAIDSAAADLADAERGLSGRREAAEDAVAALAAKLDARGPALRAILRQGATEASDKLQHSTSVGYAWGVDPGTMRRMPAKARMDLARRLNKAEFREIADLFGRIHNLALSEFPRESPYVNEEMVDLKLGSDLSAISGAEWANLADPALEDDMLARQADNELLIMDRVGDENWGRGGIVMCVDGSFSMNGTRERFAKAVMLVLLHLARQQRRTMHVIHFGGRGQTKHFPFVVPTDFTTDAIIDCAEISFRSGTNFESPMTVAVEILEGEFNANGWAESDVVFATDGECNVGHEFMADYLARMRRMKARTWGLMVSGRASVPGGPLELMSEGRVMHVQDLISGKDIRPMLRGAA